MFVLRIIGQDGLCQNRFIGDEYYLTGRFTAYEYFKEKFKDIFGKNHVADNDPDADTDTKNCMGFLQYDNTTFPLWKDERYYIMNDSGKTFQNLTAW